MCVENPIKTVEVETKIRQKPTSGKRIAPNTGNITKKIQNSQLLKTLLKLLKRTKTEVEKSKKCSADFRKNGENMV